MPLAYSGVPTSVDPTVLQQASIPIHVGGVNNHPLLSQPNQYPLTTGLMSSLSQPGAVSNLVQSMGNPQAANSVLPQDANTPAPYTGPDYSQIALQMAGNPHAGPYAPAAVPSGSFISNPATSSSSNGNSALGATAAGLLGLLAANPSLAKSLGSTIGGGLQSLLGGSSQLPTLPTSGASILGSAADTGSLGDPSIGAPTVDTGSPGDGLDLSASPDVTNLLDSLGFSGAGGQAAVQGSAADTGSLGSNLISAPDVAGDVGAPGTGLDFSANVPGLSGASGSGGSLLGDLGLGAGAISGLLSGTPTGEAQAGLDATKLAAQSGLLGSAGSAINSAAGIGSGALGLYSGLQQGGVAGDTQAALDAAQLATKAGTASGLLSSGAGSAATGLLADAAAPLALYNFAKNWQSGATAPDSLNGLGAGAAIGSLVTPGIGTVVGGAIGAGVGALTSAFGGGKVDPETASAQALDKASPAQQQAVLSNPNDALTYLTGIFDGKNDTAGHSTGLEQVFGRMGETGFTSALNNTLSSAATSGAINANTPPSQIYSQVVAPWLSSVGASIDPNGVDAQGNPMGQNMIAAVTSLIGNYQAHGFGPGAVAAPVTQPSAQSLMVGMPTQSAYIQSLLGSMA